DPHATDVRHRTVAGVSGISLHVEALLVFVGADPRWGERHGHVLTFHRFRALRVLARQRVRFRRDEPRLAWQGRRAHDRSHGPGDVSLSKAAATAQPLSPASAVWPASPASPPSLPVHGPACAQGLSKKPLPFSVWPSQLQTGWTSASNSGPVQMGATLPP